MFDTLDFQSQTRSHGHSTGAKFFCRFRNRMMFLRCDLAVSGDNTDIEHIRITLILEATQALDPLNLFRRQRATLKTNLDIIRK